MAGQIVRRKLVATNNLVAGGDGKSGCSSYSSWDVDGYVTAASSARTYKELWFNAYQLLGGEPRGDSACTHATSGSAFVDIGSAGSGGRFYIPTISACGTACDMQFDIVFPAPLDIDTATTASPWVIVEQVCTSPLATAGSFITYRLNYNYVTTGCIGTTGSALTAIQVAGASATGARISASLGKLPPPASAGQWMHLAFRQLTGSGAGAIIDVAGVRFKYIANSLGTKVT